LVDTTVQELVKAGLVTLGKDELGRETWTLTDRAQRWHGRWR
jgi:hypothetical protein